MPIIPLEAHEPDHRDMLIYDIAETIGAALSDSADIGVLEVAEVILDQVEESPIFRERTRIRVQA